MATKCDNDDDGDDYDASMLSRCCFSRTVEVKTLNNYTLFSLFSLVFFLLASLKTCVECVCCRQTVPVCLMDPLIAPGPVAHPHHTRMPPAFLLQHGFAVVVEE